MANNEVGVHPRLIGDVRTTISMKVERDNEYVELEIDEDGDLRVTLNDGTVMYINGEMIAELARAMGVVSRERLRDKPTGQTHWVVTALPEHKPLDDEDADLRTLA